MSESTLTHLEQGVLALNQGQWQEALACLRLWTEAEPTSLEGWFFLADAAQQGALWDVSEKAYRHCLSLLPVCTPAKINLAQVLQAQGHFAEAEMWVRQALEVEPEELTAQLTLGNLCFAQARYDEACQVFEILARQYPDDAEVIQNRGMALEAAGCLREAAKVFQAGIASWPQHAKLHFHYATVLLGLKQFELGWPEYEWRLMTDLIPPRLQLLAEHLPVLMGQDLSREALDSLNGPVLVLSEQGFGDMIQFSRVFAELECLKTQENKAVEWIVEVPEPLYPLLSVQDWPVRWIKRPQDGGLDVAVQAAREHQCVAGLSWLSLAGLAYPEAPPVASTAYLTADPARQALWAAQLKQACPEVQTWTGVMLSGSATNASGHRRTIPVEVALQWLGKTLNDSVSVPLQGFVWLQPEVSAEVMALLRPLKNVFVPGYALKDFAETAALITQCERVISVDTAVAHLAGALGVRCDVLLPYACDWRWFQPEPEQPVVTPWYPSLTLYRQKTPGDWASVLANL